MDVEQVRARYKRFAEEECRGYSDHYFKLSHDIANNDWLCEFIAGMPVIQPNLFLASVQYLTGPVNMPRTAAETKPLVQARIDEVTRLMQSRRTQTNEVGRCATILPALPRGRLALVEVGASAGLCLLLDEFAYQYGDTRLGSEHSTVRLTCAVTGSPPIPKSMPEVVWRAGMDLNPLDVHDEDDVRWLMSLVWPEHDERRQRLAAAIAIGQSKELNLHRGDLVSDLPALLVEVPREVTLVIFHSAALVYLSKEDCRKFANVLAEASKQRDIVWVSNESATVIPEITATAPPIEPSQKLLGRTRFTNGDRQDEFLAIAHAHGAELDWMQT